MLVSPVLSQPGLSLRVAAQIGAVECIAEQRHARDPLPVLPDELEHRLYCLGVMFGIVNVCQDDVHLGLHCDLRSKRTCTRRFSWTPSSHSEGRSMEPSSVGTRAYTGGGAIWSRPNL